ncbi:MAG: transglycosylase [Chloroflexi bacterium]|nr:MAG: transglycosylase [Chloroflexota bacterium]
MVITLGALIIWLLIAALVGFVGELLAHRRAPFGIIGAIILGFIAIFLVVGVLGIHFVGEPTLNHVPLITSIIVAAIVVAIWSAFAHRHAYGYYSRHYYRRGSYVRRPRRRYRLFR